jgi:glyoxylase-like metal-dependent hydrolase (beta-lactamase superfamily II)
MKVRSGGVNTAIFHLFPYYVVRIIDMIQIRPFVNNDFQVNSYLLWDDSGECLIVDPAFYSPEEQQHLLALLRENALQLTGMLNTHCHVDHILGVQYIREQFNLPFRAHAQEQKIVDNVPLMGDLFGWKVAPIGDIDEPVGDGDQITVGKYSLHCLLIPGHSPGSLAFYSPEGEFVITGDALFQGSIGRTDLPGGDYDTLMQSIAQRLLVLPPQTRIFPGHGPSSTIGREKEENPFLREFQ